MNDNKNLMKAIAVHEQDKDEIPLFTKQMWDSEKNDWVPFDLWGAHYIINARKETVVMRIYQPAKYQPSFGPIVKGWATYNASYLNEQLKDPENHYESYLKNCHDLYGPNSFKKIISQDKKQKSCEF